MPQTTLTPPPPSLPLDLGLLLLVGFDRLTLVFRSDDFWLDLHTYVCTCTEDARRGARGTVERAVLPHVDGARVQPHRVARRHDIRLEVRGFTK